MSPRFAALALIVLAGLQAGCADDPAAPASGATPRPPAEATEVRALASIPDPRGDVVLRLSKVPAANRRNGVAAFDKATIESLPKAEATIREPFLKRDIRFTGVLLKDLLALAGAPVREDGELHLHALDDYTIQPSLEDLLGSRAMIATRAGGTAIPVAKGGPIRMVYLDETDTSRNTDMWIWSIDAMRLVG